jgi:hypothetical protein
MCTQQQVLINSTVKAHSSDSCVHSKNATKFPRIIVGGVDERSSSAYPLLSTFVTTLNAVLVGFKPETAKAAKHWL